MVDQAGVCPQAVPYAVKIASAGLNQAGQKPNREVIKGGKRYLQHLKNADN
jgi:hypothetical protein